MYNYILDSITLPIFLSKFGNSCKKALLDVERAHVITKILEDPDLKIISYEDYGKMKAKSGFTRIT